MAAEGIDDKRAAWAAFHAECRRPHTGAEELQVDLIEPGWGGRVLESWSEIWGASEYAGTTPDRESGIRMVQKLIREIGIPDGEVEG